MTTLTESMSGLPAAEGAGPRVEAQAFLLPVGAVAADAAGLEDGIDVAGEVDTGRRWRILRP